MKLKIYPYSKNFPKQYEKEKEKIRQSFKELGNYKTSHIGSTSVPGLGGKGIIDVMIGIKSWIKRNQYIRQLKTIGFNHIHPEEKGRIFLSRIRKTKKGDIHIHLVKLNSPELKRHLKFRYYLRTHKAEAKKYWQAKLKLIRKTKGNRIIFGKLKNKYIENLQKDF
ncbi:GrpB family protein [Candidatus Microgenomates bacterium]|nr:GrpB family protein [Candidatus Microgenomates bacterium]